MEFLKLSQHRLLTRMILQVIAKINNNKYRRYYVMRYGYHIYMNLSEPLTVRRLLGQYDRHKFDFLEHFLKNGMTFIDVGANLGDYTFFAARRVGSEGSVLSFEPEPNNYLWLKKGIAKNRFKNVDLKNSALSDKDGEAKLYLGELSGWHTLKAGENNANCGQILVTTNKLDSLALEKVDCIKIDVEGLEYEVLLGALDTIRNNKPAILMDFHPQHGVEVDVVKGLLHEMGYETFQKPNIWISSLPDQ
jgi:FkbM family methyltransferase